MSKLFVGAGKARIALSEPLPPNQEGFTRILDPLYVRVVLFRANVSAAIVSLELTSLMGGNDVLRERVRSITGAEHVWVTVTHTFSTPHIQASRSGGPKGGPGPGPRSPGEQAAEREQTQRLLSAVDEAAKMAVNALEEAVISGSYGHSTINVGRDVETAQGWWLAEGSSAYSDHTLPVAFIHTVKGDPLAAVFNFPVQSSVLDHAVMEDGGFVISGDLAGRASAAIERVFPVAVFLCGAAGDQAPWKKASTNLVEPDGTLRHIERGAEGIAIKNALGDKLGDAVLAERENAVRFDPDVTISATGAVFPVPAKIMPDRREVMARTVPNYEDNGTTQAELELLRIGELVLVGLKPELSASIGTEIRNNSPFELTMVATMVNGGAKYMADKKGFAHISYAAQNSPFGCGAAEELGRQAIKALNEMWRQ